MPVVDIGCFRNYTCYSDCNSNYCTYNLGRFAMELGLFLLHAVPGLLLMGHGAQKLFGWFGGHGPAGTGQFMETLGMRPGRRMAMAAGANEFAGGALLALGLLMPLAALLIASTMLVASLTAHRGKGPWNTNGGWELPLLLA
jgi:putative oxidoreductase